MYLYVLQHGEAVSKQVDPDRPLSERGVSDIRTLATHLRKMDLQLQTVLHSGKLRAEQTARLVAETLSPEVEPVQADGLNPNDDPNTIISDIEQRADNVLIASHMPFVSRLCSTLLTGTTAVEFASVPGTLLCLEKVDGRWRLAAMLRPDFL